MGKHVEMPLLVSAFGPGLRLLFVDLERYFGSLWIADLYLIHPGKGLDNTLFSKPPDVSGKSRRFVHQLPTVVENEVAEKFLAVLAHRSTGCRASAALEKDCVHFRMLVQIFDQSIRKPLAREFVRRRFELRRYVSLFFEQRFVQVRSSFFEPFLGNFRIGKTAVDPALGFHVAQLGRISTRRLLGLACLIPVDADQLIFRHDLRFDTVLFIGALDRLHDHVFGDGIGDNQHHAFLH